MDELPSMQLTEALLDGLPLGHGACGADAPAQYEQQDFDVFAFVDALGLDEELELPEVHLGVDYSPETQQCNIRAAQPAAQRKSESDTKERIRARNRRSQARYRQKAKVYSSRVLYIRCSCDDSVYSTVPRLSHASPYAAHFEHFIGGISSR